MKIYLQLILLSFVILFAKVDINSSKSKPLIVRYIIGKPAIRQIEMSQKVAKEWGINIKYMFGSCSYTKKDKAIIKKYEKGNAKAIKFYNKKFGKDWQKRLHKEVMRRLKLENNIFKK